jgi:hypothetical protein
MNESILKEVDSYIDNGKLQSNYSKLYTARRDAYAKELAAEPHVSVKTIMYCLHNRKQIKTCGVCNKQLNVHNMSGMWPTFCSKKCGNAFVNMTYELPEDLSILFDMNGYLSESKCHLYIGPNNSKILIDKHKAPNFKTALTIELFGLDKIKFCEECGEMIPVHNCVSDLPYKKPAKFCSNECRNKNDAYKENISKKKTGIKRNSSENYRNSVSIPWFHGKKQMILEKENVDIKCTYDDYLNDHHETKYDCECLECGHTFKFSFISKIPWCNVCNCNSKPQKRVYNIFKENGFHATMNNRNVVAGKEVDIYCQELNIGVEFDGLWFHKNKDDYIKYEECTKRGIRLLKIYDDEDETIVRSRVESILGKSKFRLFARNCTVKEIDVSVAKSFLKSNHVQGYANSAIKIGLYHESDLVSVMTFGKPRFNKNYEYELIRFASLLNHQVIGASKMFSYFVKKFNPKNIISYCDMRYGSGGVYEKLGFEFKHKTPYGYYWYSPKQIRYSRIEFQKHKLKDKLQNFDPKLSEEENMINNGYSKIYDFGHNVYVKEF